MKLTEIDLDILTRRLSAFQSFQGLLDAQGDYRPSLDCGANSGMRFDMSFDKMAERNSFADAYDAAQKARGDKRRVYRY